MSAGFRAPTLVLLAALCAAAVQDTRPPLPQGPPTIRITVTLIQVDAVVTDSQGRHVTDLGPQDFEILQDGVFQKITHFAYIPEAANLPPPEIKRTGEKAPLGPPAPITPSQVKRTVALVVDDLALSFENLVRVRDAMRKYIERDMQPGDLVALIRTGGGVAILEQFTTDKRILLEGVDLLKWKFAGRVGLLPIDAVDSGPEAPADGAPRGPELLDYGYSLYALGALDTLEDVVGEMKKLPGRKSVVFLSDGLRMDPRINFAIDRLTDLANRSAVSLYTIDPAGLRTNSLTAADSVDVSGPNAGATLGGILAGRREEEFRLQDALNYLATRTGGLFFSNRNDIQGCVREAAEDQLGYYLLGYSPPEGTFEKNAPKAKFHRLTVRVRRPGLRVRWKSGFAGVPDGVPDTQPVSAPRTREQQLIEALASPFTAAALKVRLTSLYLDMGGKTGSNVRSMLYFGGKELAFTQDAGGVWHATVDIVTLAYRGLKQPIQQRQRVQDISLPDDQYRRALKEGFLLMLDDPMKQPGTFLMRAVVRDAASQRIGSASQFIQVPDTKKGQLALSGVWLNLAPSAPSAAQQPADSLAGQDGKVEAWVEGGPAVRRYRPGQRILYAFMVVNPKVRGSAKKPGVVSQVRVFRNGKLFYTGPPNALLADGRLDARRFIGGGVLHLGGKLTPGEYLLQVVVTDQLAKKKKSQVAQWTDFEVTAAPSL
jgi:VWFA-related protein